LFSAPRDLRAPTADRRVTLTRDRKLIFVLQSISQNSGSFL